jgi:hypothetical protein
LLPSEAPLNANYISCQLRASEWHADQPTPLLDVEALTPNSPKRASDGRQTELTGVLNSQDS